MNLTIRITGSRTIIACCFGLLVAVAPATASAQQLRQPKSVLPWVPPKTEVAKPLRGSRAIPEPSINMSVWMRGSAPKAVVKRSRKATLPVVEKDHYAHLGDMPVGSAGPSRAASPVTTSRGAVIRSAQGPRPLRLYRGVR